MWPVPSVLSHLLEFGPHLSFFRFVRASLPVRPFNSAFSCNARTAAKAPFPVRHLRRLTEHSANTNGRSGSESEDCYGCRFRITLRLSANEIFPKIQELMASSLSGAEMAGNNDVNKHYLFCGWHPNGV
jgi:hypothetical protein